ncbi:MAG: hypothetical protein V2A61_07655, partial [Calditrichota bacterium]
MEELGIHINSSRQPIQFLPNSSEIVHRWSPYVQGFSAKFVQGVINRYISGYKRPTILDPFAGSGTVLVQAKLNNLESYGVELNPLLHFIAETKINTWTTNPNDLLRISKQLSSKTKYKAPSFLKSNKHFNINVLHNLERIKGGIDEFEPTPAEKSIKDLMLLAFASILIDCSNLKRSPCLGYSPTKTVEDDAPFVLFYKKIEEIAEDLWLL